MKRQVRAPDGKTENPDAATCEAGPRRCATDGCPHEGIYPAPRSRDALRDYLWFCLDHVRAYNKAWNYYDGLQGAALKPEYAAPQPGNGQAEICYRPAGRRHADPLGLFDRTSATHQTGRLPSVEERAARHAELSPVDDLLSSKSNRRAGERKPP